MKRLAIPFLLFFLASCTSEDMAYISIGNNTDYPIYTLPYADEFTDGDWIQPGSINEFFTLNNDALDGFEYFSYYYDSLVVYIKGHESNPVKFYSDGTVINYDREFNPFTNPDVWQVQESGITPSGSAFDGFEEKILVEHYFTITASKVLSLSDSISAESDPVQ